MQILQESYAAQGNEVIGSVKDVKVMGDSAANTAATTEKATEADHTEMAANANKEKKPSFFKGLKTEYKKIVFADRQTVTRQTIAVVITAICIGAIIALLDLIIKFGLSFIF